jgi:hypothetical protein
LELQPLIGEHDSVLLARTFTSIIDWQAALGVTKVTSGEGPEGLELIPDVVLDEPSGEIVRSAP